MHWTLKSDLAEVELFTWKYYQNVLLIQKDISLKNTGCSIISIFKITEYISVHGCTDAHRE